MRHFLFAFLLLFLPLSAVEKPAYVILPEESVHEGDYFAAGGSIEISGVVKGDVYVFGSRVMIDGDVEGSVIATGGTITLSGNVSGNVRIAGGQIELDGTILQNVTVMGGNVELSTRARVGKNAVITGGMVNLEGTIGGNLTVTASNARLSGDVGGNVKGYVGQMRLSSRADIHGNFEYSSSSEAFIDNGADIRGQVIYHPSVVREVFRGKWTGGVLFGTKMTGLLMNFLFSFVVGLIFYKLFPKRLKAAVLLIEKNPWKAFWTGILIAILLPIAVLILFVTILGFPIALALVALSLLGFYSGKIFPIFYFSNRFLPKIKMKKDRLATFFVGLVLFFLLLQIPFFGSILSLIFTFIGLGALVIGKLPKKAKK